MKRDTTKIDNKIELLLNEYENAPEDSKEKRMLEVDIKYYATIHKNLTGDYYRRKI